MKKNIIKQVLFTLGFTLAVILFSILLRWSEVHSVNQYLDAHTIWPGSRYRIVGTDLNWFLTDLSVTSNVSLGGWKKEDFNQGREVKLNGHLYTPKEYIDDQSGELMDGLLLLTATVCVINRNEGDSNTFEPYFIQLGNRRKPVSFTYPYPCAAVSIEQNDDHSGGIYVAPGEQIFYRIAFILDDDVSLENACLFAKVIPTQSVGVCLQLNSEYAQQLILQSKN